MDFHATIIPQGCDNQGEARPGSRMLDVERVFRKHVYGYLPHMPVGFV